MKYRHYVITRFNINIESPVKDPNNSPKLRRLDEDYLQDRFYLFEKYTLPSVMNQINQNFKWIILFHKKTPKKFLNKIKELKKLYEFEDLYFDDNERFNFSDYCNSRNVHYDFYITTRIDNDDMINENYIKEIQEYADINLHECFISFPKGAKIDLNFGKNIDTYYELNHFTSLFASKKETVLDFDHTIIDKLDKDIVLLDTEKPMWTEIIHESNVVNEITPYEMQRYNSRKRTNKKNDVTLYQLINLKNKFNKEKRSLLNEYVSIDDYTFGKPKIIRFSGAKLNIGKFCCIEGDVTFLLGDEHRIDWISTYPFNMLVNNFHYIKGDSKIKGDINVGNDVLIGHGAKILSGVNIGDGAVILANSLVTGDVPNYAIVAGNPAAVIRYRFDKKTISKLEEIKWWNFKEDKLVKIIPYLQNNDIEKLFEIVDNMNLGEMKNQ